MPRLHCLIRGRVQGVGFRYFAEREAMRNGLNGWVRNCRGGAVETEVEGPREALEKYLAQMRRGPALSYVADVDEEWEEGEALHKDFQIRPTAY
ncbi:MAG: acylphosphatase [Candidatus Sumerlaeota bacterium]|nr:acylphosphatase [Candidatus Sumerlaeota bacterium]